MATKGYKAKLFLDAIAMALSTTNLGKSTAVETIPYNVLQTPSTLKIAGLSMRTVTINGIVKISGSDDLRLKAQEALTSNDTKVVWMLDTDSNSPIGGSFSNSFVSSFNIDSPLDTLLTIQSTWEDVEGGTEGYFISNEELVDSTGVLTNYADFGVAGTGGGDALLIITAIDGTATDATITVESDDNTGFTSPATEGTFTFSAVGVYSLSLSGTIDRYVRANLTSLGGATSVTATILVGLNGVTQ